MCSFLCFSRLKPKCIGLIFLVACIFNRQDVLIIRILLLPTRPQHGNIVVDVNGIFLHTKETRKLLLSSDIKKKKNIFLCSHFLQLTYVLVFPPTYDRIKIKCYENVTPEDAKFV